jgi:hypothetical protein
VKRNIHQAVAILFLSGAVLRAASAERWIHVRVESAKGVSGAVNVNLPIEMASAVLPLIPGDHQHHGRFSLQASVNGQDLRALLDAVHKTPDNVFVTLERHGKEVSVAKSGQNLLIKIVSKASGEDHPSETIVIKVPVAVVRAMLADNSDEVDVSAALRELTREGDVDVTVKREKETVRVWTDTHTTSD